VIEKKVIIDADGDWVNCIALRRGAEWSPPDGATVVDAEAYQTALIDTEAHADIAAFENKSDKTVEEYRLLMRGHRLLGHDADEERIYKTAQKILVDPEDKAVCKWKSTDRLPPVLTQSR
jgi:hypothetical protein